MKRPDGWAYAPGASRRDLRLDLLRGFAVLAMIVDHFGGRSYLTLLTGNNEFLVSAAEAFVFLSGFVMGIVYGGRIDRVGWLPTAEAILRRAALLYAVTVGLTLTFVGLFLFTDLRLWFDRQYGLGLTDPVELVVGTLTLHYTYHGTDILWMYTVLIAACPILFHLLYTGRTWLVAGGSFLLWLAYQQFPSQAAIPWVAGNAVYFPVAAWQLYFVGGLVLGYHRGWLAERLGRVPRWPLLGLVALAFLGLILLDWSHKTGRLPTWWLMRGLAGETYLEIFNKPAVSWGRVVAFAIAASFFFLLVDRLWRPLHRSLGWLLIPLGQAALLAYGLHLLVIVAIYNVDLWGLYERSRLANTGLQALAVLAVWGLVRVWDRLGAIPRRLGEVLDAPLRWPAQRRAAVATAAGLLLVLAAGTTLLVGPVRAARSLRTAESAAGSAGTLVYVSETPAALQTTRVLLVLHDEQATGPMTAIPLIDEARRAGWSVLAPTLDYGEWRSQDDVRAMAAETLPELRELVDQLDDHIGRPTRPRVLLYGEGRGGQLATMFALFYPEVVRGVATVDTVPCTLPLATPPEAVPFPVGLGDLPEYRGEPIDEQALSTVAFWLNPPPAATAGQPCGWLEQPVDQDQQVAQFTSLLEGVGAEVVVVRDGLPPEQASERALRFLEALPPRI